MSNPRDVSSGNPELDALWDQAWKSGEAVDVGPLVVCDGCSEDFSNSDAEGGMLFQSKALCPKCASKWEEGAKKYGAEHFIRARAEPGESFKAFTLRMRGGNNTIRVGLLRTT